MSNLPGRTVTRGRGQRPGSEEQGPRHWLRQLLASGARAAAGTGGAEAGGEGGALGALLRGTVSSNFKEAVRDGPVHLAASTGFAWAKKSRPDATAAAAVTKTTARESRCPRPPVAATSAAFGSAWAAPAPPQIRCPWPPPPAAGPPAAT